jgi:hypothetical protein
MEKAIKLGHEPSAISVKGVIWFLIGMMLTIAATFAFVWVVWHFLIVLHEKEDVPNSAFVTSKITPTGSGPLLQPSVIHDHVEHEDLDAMHDGENQRFSQMGWLQSDGRVVVSAQVADQIVQLTKEKGAEAPAFNGWATPSSSSGSSNGTSK